MAKVTIGEVEYSVDLPNFKALKAVWGFVSQVQESSEDPTVAVDAILGIVASRSTPPSTVDQLEEQLTPAQMMNGSMTAFLNELLIESGLAKRPGEATPAEA